MLRAIFLAILLVAPAAVFSAETPPVSTYRHVSGLEFMYPRSWTIRAPSFAVAELIPPGRASNEQGITEGYFLWGIGGKYQGVADAKLAQILDSLVRQMVPFLERSGEAEVSGTIGILTWSGKPVGGDEVSARVLVVAQETSAWALAAIGLREQILAREPELRAMASSFRTGDFIRDFALIGKWIAPPGQTQPAPGQGASLEVRMDGSFLFLDPSAGADAASEMSGTWYAADGLLYFVLPEGVNAHLYYELEGDRGSRTLTLVHSTGGRQILVESPEKKESE